MCGSPGPRSSPLQLPWAETMGRLTPLSRARRGGGSVPYWRGHYDLRTKPWSQTEDAWSAGAVQLVELWKPLWKACAKWYPNVSPSLYFSWWNQEFLIFFLPPFLLQIIPSFLYSFIQQTPDIFYSGVPRWKWGYTHLWGCGLSRHVRSAVRVVGLPLFISKLFKERSRKRCSSYLLLCSKTAPGFVA